MLQLTMALVSLLGLLNAVRPSVVSRLTSQGLMLQGTQVNLPGPHAEVNNGSGITFETCLEEHLSVRVLEAWCDWSFTVRMRGAMRLC
jgi:hypothetical protein